MKKLVTLLMFTFLSASVYASGVDDIAKSYLNAFKAKDFKKATGLLHCPENYTMEKLKFDQTAIQKVLSIFDSELGGLHKFSVSSDNKYTAAMTACGTIDYWKKNQPSQKIIFETINSNNEQGFIALSFSKIGENYVLAFVYHGVPGVGVESVAKIKSIYQKMSAMQI